MTIIPLSPLDLAAGAALLLAEAALSALSGLGLHRPLLVAAARMVVQLLLVGYALRLVFALSSPVPVALVAAAMTLVAAREVAARPERRLENGGNLVVGSVAVACATAVTVALALGTAIRPTPWWSPRYAIPLVGIVLGSVLGAASLSLHHVLDGANRDRTAIETRLALGETFGGATAPLLREAVRRGMMPIVNQMSAAGIVTLPGTMTGQILAGLDPVRAVDYQILLMFLLAGAGVLAAFLAASGALRLLGDGRDRLRLDRLRTRGEAGWPFRAGPARRRGLIPPG